MNNLNKRLQALESQQPSAPVVNTRYTDAAYNRSMEALAAAMRDITGQPVTAEEAGQAIKELKP